MSDATATSATVTDPANAAAAPVVPATPAPVAAVVDAGKPAVTPVVPATPTAAKDAKADAVPEAPKRLLADEPAKPVDAVKDAPKAEEWKLETPKDSLVTAAEFTAMEAEAKKLGLTKDQANGLVSFRDAQARAEFTATDKRWYDEAMANPDIGGTKMPETVALCKKFMAAHMPPEMVKAVINSPFANNPVFLYITSKAGALMATEDKVHASGGQPQGKSYPQTHDERARAMYSDLYK